MVAPGGGAGNQAAAMGVVNRAFEALKSVFMGFPNGSKEQQAVMRAMTALNPLFGGNEAAAAGPAAGQRLAQAGMQPNPALAGTPNPGVNIAPMRPQMMNKAMSTPA